MIRLADDDGEHAVLHDLGGSGPNLLLTHGNGLNSGMWADVIPRLRCSFRCWGIDSRGHGAARPRRPDMMSVDRRILAGEVLAAVDRLGGGPVLAVGHSAGASTLLTVVRGDVHPPRRMRLFRDAELLADALPRGRLETLHGLTHLGPMEDSSATADSIVGALKS